MEIAGRSAIVTGGAGGLGSASVRRLVAAGMKVVIFDRVAEPAEALAQELGPDTIAVVGDTTDDTAVGAAILAAQDLGRLTVVVNVAGGGIGGGRTVGKGNVPHDWDAFVGASSGRLVLMTTRASVPLPAARFRPDDILLFGSEGAGVPGHVHDAAALGVRIPMRRGFRSLNVAVAAGIALGEALRQTEGWPE